MQKSGKIFQDGKKRKDRRKEGRKKEKKETKGGKSKIKTWTNPHSLNLTNGSSRKEEQKRLVEEIIEDIVQAHFSD